MPTFHPEVLKQPFTLRHPEKARVLVCFTGELGGLWVPQDWQEAVVDTIRHCSQPLFLLLTKEPNWYVRFNPWPLNTWVGITLTGAEPPGRQRAMLEALQRVQGAGVKWLSYEPAIKPLTVLLPSWLDWVVIGGWSNKRPLSAGGYAGVENIVLECEARNIPRWEKRNLSAVLEAPLHQALPHGEKP